MGCRILLTRPPARARGLAGKLQRLGARVECRPTIDLVGPRDEDPCRRAVEQIDRYAWVLFTSANGVRFFLRRLERSRLDPGAVAARMGAVGPATASAVRAAGWSAEVVAADSRAEGLVEAVAGRIDAGSRVLVVRPETGRAVLEEKLRERGAVVTAVPFYRNVAAVGLQRLAAEIVAGRFRGVVFTSPSSLERLIELPETSEGIHRALGQLRRVAIGSVTAAALEHHGLAADAVATSPDDDALARAVADVFAS